MSVSDPGEKIEWGADSEPRKNERLPSSAITVQNVGTNYYLHVVKIQCLRRNCSDYRSLSELKVGLLGVGEMGQALARAFAGQLIKM